MALKPVEGKTAGEGMMNAVIVLSVYVCVGAAVPGDTFSMLCSRAGVHYLFSISVK
jgi:hypothetical protein